VDIFGSASLRARVVNSSAVSLRRAINGLDTIASLTLSLPALSRLREPPSQAIAPSSLWALDHDPFFVVLVSEVPALLDPPPRCACRFRLDGSRGTTLACGLRSTLRSMAGPPTDLNLQAKRVSAARVECLRSWSIRTRSVLQEGGNRLSPPGLPLGPRVCELNHRPPPPPTDSTQSTSLTHCRVDHKVCVGVRNIIRNPCPRANFVTTCPISVLSFAKVCKSRYVFF
jgi:hypothetical protein